MENPQIITGANKISPCNSVSLSQIHNIWWRLNHVNDVIDQSIPDLIPINRRMKMRRSLKKHFWEGSKAGKIKFNHKDVRSPNMPADFLWWSRCLCSKPVGCLAGPAWATPVTLQWACGTPCWVSQSHSTGKENFDLWLVMGLEKEVRNGNQRRYGH